MVSMRARVFFPAGLEGWMERPISFLFSGGGRICENSLPGSTFDPKNRCSKWVSESVNLALKELIDTTCAVNLINSRRTSNILKRFLCPSFLRGRRRRSHCTVPSIPLSRQMSEHSDGWIGGFGGKQGPDSPCEWIEVNGSDLFVAIYFMYVCT